MVLFAIIKSILTNSWGWSVKDEKSPLWIIKTTLIAGILIQASRFLLAALIDVSTIATYAVGGLPLSVLKDTDIGKQKILSVNSSIDLNKFDLLNKKWDFLVWYSTTYSGHVLKISPCKVAYSYVIWREQWDPKFRNTDYFSWTNDPYKWYEVCVLFGSKLVMRQEDALMSGITEIVSTATGDYKTDWWYQSRMTALTNHTWWQNDHMTWALSGAVNINSWSNAWFAKWKSLFDASTSMTIADLIKKSKWFVWPLVTIYASLLNFAQLSDSSVSSIWETSGIFIIKTWVAIALFFPLIALAVVLIARIGVLRLYIVASPFIVIKESFKNFIKMEWLDKYLSLKAIMGIVFAPVVTVAALSISLIFMTALVNGFKSPDANNALYDSLGTQKMQAEAGRDAISFEGITEIEFTKLPWWEAMDWFSWLIVNFFAIGLMWMIVFAAIKANALGEKIGGGVQSFWSNVFQTLPILPIGEGGKWVGIGSAARVINRMPDAYVTNQNTVWEAQATEWLWQWPDNKNIPTTITTDQAQKFITASSTSADITSAVQKLWVEQTNVGTVLTGSTTALFEAVNKLDKDKQAAVITAISTASGGKLDKDRFTAAKTTAEATATTTAAKTTLDTFINGKTPKDETTLRTVVQADWSKDAIEAYFTAAGADAKYEITVGKEPYALTRTVTWTWTTQVIKYDVVKATP